MALDCRWHFFVNSVIQGIQRNCAVGAIWHGVRYGHKVFKNHHIQVGLAPWWPVCAKSNIAAETRDLK